jgi:hypothetical protein
MNKNPTTIPSKKHSSDSSDSSDEFQEVHKNEKRGRKNKTWLMERKNKNVILLDKDSEDDIYIKIQEIASDFTSRDLARLYVTLSKSRTDHDYSLKSIRYWEELSNNSKFKKLFRKYKPWTIHTNYKRIFTYVTLEEAIEILRIDTEADVSSLLKLSRSRKLSKKYIGGINKYKQEPKAVKENLIKRKDDNNKKVNVVEEVQPEKSCDQEKENLPCKNMSSSETHTLPSQDANARQLGRKRRRFRIMKNSAVSKYSILSVRSTTQATEFANISAFDPVISIKSVSKLDKFFAKYEKTPFSYLFKNVEDNRAYRILENKLSDLYDHHNSIKNKSQSK